MKKHTVFILAIACFVAGMLIWIAQTRLQAFRAHHTAIARESTAGIASENVLRAAGINAAGALSASLQFGRIAASAQADLVFVDGDPLTDIEDAMNVIAVVRNGRFYSVAGLLETAASAKAP